MKKKKKSIILTLSHKFVDLLNPVQKTIESNGYNLPLLNCMSLPLMLTISAGKTCARNMHVSQSNRQAFKGEKKNKQELKKQITLILFMIYA